MCFAMPASSQQRSSPGEPVQPRLARGVFAVYKRVVSPILHAFSPSQCVYLPTCSEYAYLAIERFGWWRGSWLALRRLARCHPWSSGGFDPVPERGVLARPFRRTKSGQSGTDHLP